jgi:hypothetical protein
MSVAPIYADFNNVDPKGRLRLNCIGTIQDLARLGITLYDGLHILLRDTELEVEGVVHFSSDESIWVAEIDSTKIATRRAQPG